MKMKFVAFLLIIILQFMFIPAPQAHAYTNPAAVPLLTVSNFATLAKSLISSPTGPTTLNNGDLGIDSPGTCTGFASPCTGSINGTINNGTIQYQNGVALQGQTDATAAVTNIGLRTANQTLTSALDGLTLSQGVYDIPHDPTANLTGDLTLNGDADSVFILHLTSDLVTANGSRVLLTGGAQACHVFWKVDSSATFNGTSTIVGTVLAQTSVTFPGGGTTLNGRAIAQTAAITLNNTTINNSSCTSTSTSSSSNGSGEESNQVPAIHITKEANPTSLPNGPDPVTYTYQVTNPGDLILNNVTLTDNRCSPVTFLSGDRNNDSMLDLDEIWTYRCTTLVTRSVTNTATVHGFANGVDVHDSAQATVIVGNIPAPAPLLPNTGFAPQIINTLWHLLNSTHSFFINLVTA